MAKLKFTITMSIDGYVAGPNQSLENPLGEGGQGAARMGVRDPQLPRPHTAMDGGEDRLDDESRGEERRTSAPRSWAATCSGRSAGRGATARGTAGGATTRRSTRPSSCLPITRASRSSSTAEQPSISSRTASRLRSNGRSRRPGDATSRSAAARGRAAILAAGLIDEFELHVVPLILGGGERLFENADRSLDDYSASVSSAPASWLTTRTRVQRGTDAGLPSEEHGVQRPVALTQRAGSYGSPGSSGPTRPAWCRPARVWNNRPVVPEAPLAPAGSGLGPAGEGWFVLSARDARWTEGHFGAFTRFEGARLPQVGVNIAVLEPGSRRPCTTARTSRRTSSSSRASASC